MPGSPSVPLDKVRAYTGSPRSRTSTSQALAPSSRIATVSDSASAGTNGTSAPSASAPTPTRSGSCAMASLTTAMRARTSSTRATAATIESCPSSSRPRRRQSKTALSRSNGTWDASSYASTSASCFCAVPGKASRWMAAREPSTAAATWSAPLGSPSSARSAAIRVASTTPPLAATSAVATRTSASLRYAERTSATFTLALPMSMPSHVGMPLVSRYSMLK